MARAALVPQARAPPATPEAPMVLVARVVLMVPVARVGLVLRARASSTPSATLVVLAARVVLVLVLGVGCERRWL